MLACIFLLQQNATDVLKYYTQMWHIVLYRMMDFAKTPAGHQIFPFPQTMIADRAEPTVRSAPIWFRFTARSG